MSSLEIVHAAFGFDRQEQLGEMQKKSIEPSMHSRFEKERDRLSPTFTYLVDLWPRNQIDAQYFKPRSL